MSMLYVKHAAFIAIKRVSGDSSSICIGHCFIDTWLRTIKTHISIINNLHNMNVNAFERQKWFGTHRSDICIIIFYLLVCSYGGTKTISTSLIDIQIYRCRVPKCIAYDLFIVEWRNNVNLMDVWYPSRWFSCEIWWLVCWGNLNCFL